MSNPAPRVLASRVVLVLLLLVGASTWVGCGQDDQSGPSSSESATTASTAAEPTTVAEESTTVPGYESWVVYINDDDSYTEGEVTYSIALDLTATNSTQSIDGTYTGTATAKVDTTGTINGQPLNASAIANSSKLEFTLAEGFDTAGGALAPLSGDEAVYSGSGTIVMQAAGSESLGQSSGGFSNTSGQTIEVMTQGPAVTLTVVLSGHKYTFEGTLSGK